jgi:lipoate-protein ligase A
VTWFLLNSGPGHYAFNMALDEALLESMPRLGKPVLRFYGWVEPAASFGYFQKIAEVERLTSLRPLVRRPTGGGIVPHDGDWTYSLVFPTTHEWYELSAIASYRRGHEWIRDAFRALSIEAELAPAASKVQSGQCFAGHEQYDLVAEGRKLAGAAQRRRRDGLLIQGSIQPPDLLAARPVWEDAMREIGEIQYGISWMHFTLDEVLRHRADELVGTKYSRPEYNRKR